MSDQDFRIAASMPSHGVLVLEVAGELDMATAQRLRDELDQWLGITELTVDLARCTFIDSQGLHALLDCFRQMGPEATMRVVDAAPNVDHILRLAGFETLFGLDPAT